MLVTMLRKRPGQFQERPSSTEIVEILRVATGSVKVYIARVQNTNECESPYIFVINSGDPNPFGCALPLWPVDVNYQNNCPGWKSKPYVDVLCGVSQTGQAARMILLTRWSCVLWIIKFLFLEMEYYNFQTIFKC